MRQQAVNAAEMIRMMVGDQNIRQLQTVPFKNGENRASVSRVDDDRMPAFAQQPDVVILEGSDLNDVEHRSIVKERLKMSIPGLDEWLQSAQGRYLMAWEQRAIDRAVADVFGYNALQLGLPQYGLLAENRIPLRQTADETSDADVRCDLRQLPFAAHSIDLIVMPHVLEFRQEPHQILREVERVLIPEGMLVISGFNPLSLWGLRRRLAGRAAQFPWNGTYLSTLRLKDWLQLLGFEVDRAAFGCYAPPFDREAWLRRWQFSETLGDRWWNFAGAVYLLCAVKRVHGMRLILPGWKQPRAARKGLSIVSQKGRELHE
jgi:SAM-dependent methyltransferase